MKNDKWLTRGFSLMELMIGLGVVGVVALGAAKLMTDSQKNQSYTVGMTEINQTMVLAQNTLMNKSRCNFILGDFTSSTTFPASLTELKQQDAPAQIKVGDYGKYRIDSIQVENSPGNIRAKDFVFSFTWKNREYLRNDSIKKTVTVFAEINPGQDGVVNANDKWECGGVVQDSKIAGQRSLCESLGSDFAEWGTPLPDQCNIKEFRCPTGQVAYVLNHLGQVGCKPTQEALDLNNLIDTSSVECPATRENIKIEFSGGRYRLVCPGCMPTDSNWSVPGSWSACVGGFRSRTKTCVGTVACGGTNYCTGSATETEACTPAPGPSSTPSCTPVNGGWSAFTPWSSCVGGMKGRTRVCNNPAPSCGGAACVGTAVETQPCSCLPNGTRCDQTGPMCYGQSCSSCCSAPVGLCGWASQPAYQWGVCGQSATCNPQPNCL